MRFCPKWEDCQTYKLFLYNDAYIIMRDGRVPSPYIPLAGENQVFKTTCKNVNDFDLGLYPWVTDEPILYALKK
jgi:hypothetical protein